jgi:16S rRNA (cytosine1402-N4)-methyltransferase
VMLSEVLEGLEVHSGGSYIDCTLGDAGHATAILEAASAQGSGRLLGIDADPEAVAYATRRLSRFGTVAVMVNDHFDHLEEIASRHGFMPADGILFDLGLSSRQLEDEDRGFSFNRPGPLDMRFAGAAGPTADDLVNETPTEELADIIFQFGEEPRSRRIARGIVAARPIHDAAELADVVRRASGYPRGRTHPATRTFQALRMAVNDEVGRLRAALAQTTRVLREGGRVVTIAYHSIEDREIKRFVMSPDSGVHPVSRKVTKPSKEEVASNRRSRSAKLRVAICGPLGA